MPARILVVDDEPALCELAREWFESLGCDVRCVHSGSQAVAALEQGEYELLFSDVIMPDGMDGLMLAGEVNRRWPKVKVLLASGYAKGLTEYQDLPWPLLNKPYRKADLAREIRSLVASE